MTPISLHIATIILAVLTSSATPVTSSTAQYVGQLRIYVDKAGMEKWTKVTGKTQHSDFQLEMNSTIYEINEILKTLRPHGVDIQLQIDDLIVLNKNILEVDSEGKIINSDTVVQFERWLRPSYANNKYDLAILYTGHNMVRSKTVDKAYGYAYIGALCTATALGVIELHGSYYDVLAAAHEIGHILGGQHDGSKFSPLCSATSGEILNAFTMENSRKHFSFSACSATNIKATLNKLNQDNNNCLTSWNPAADLKGPRYGSLSSPDGFCARKFGPSSYLARAAYSSYGDNICTQMACMTKTVGTHFYWNFIVTPQGLKCGKNKQCIQGRCVATDGGSSEISDTCPFGDQPQIEGSYQMTCSQIPGCSGWNNTCCQTCHDPGTADDVCRSHLGRDSAMARRAYSSYGDDLCSKLACLNSVVGNRFNWNYFTAPDGMKCGKNKRCSNGKCVTSAVGDPNMPDSCPYGDQPWLAGSWQTTCDAYVTQHGCTGDGWKEICCGTCLDFTSVKDPGTADEVCQSLVGANSSMARRHYSNYGDDLCSQLACLTSVVGNRFNWNYFTQTNGMKCGKSKRCMAGKCVSTATGDPNMSDMCPYGDQPWLAGIWQTTCAKMTQNNNCRGWEEICCSSC